MAMIKILKPTQPAQSQAARRRASGLNNNGGGIISNFSAFDDLLYKGRQDRIERYKLYDAMDEDVDIARALDMIAEHCTNESSTTGIPFEFSMDEDEVTSEDVEILNDGLYRWDRLNNWSSTLWRIVRNVVKFGDAFFIRDPKTFKLHQVAARQVVGIYVDRDDRSIQAYHFKELNFVIDEVMDFSIPQGTTTGYSTGRVNSPQGELRKEALVLAEHVIQITMSEGNEEGGNGQHEDIWPFGESFLEQVYKDFRKREALETAAVIHRMQRAPSRRVWTIDVGKMRPDQVKSYMKRYKDELLHKRIPTKTGGQDQLDAVYNPVSMMEDIFLPQSAGGRGSTVTNLEGSQWSGLDDLKYFNSKLIRGLRIPSSFMLGPEEGGAQYNDGRVGTAYIQELQFAKFCRRIQDLVKRPFGREFKMYLKACGLQIDSSDYDLTLVEPINFDEYREGALDQDRLARMSSAGGFPWISKRFAALKYGGWTADDLAENERYWAEENVPDAVKGDAQTDGYGGMNVGASMPLGGGNDFGMDMAGTPGMDDMGAGPGVGQGTDMGTAAVGGMPGGTGTAPGTESMAPKTNGEMLVEQYAQKTRAKPIARPVSQPVERKIVAEERHEDRSQQPNEEDILFWAGDGDPVNSDRPRLTMSQIRKMRVEKEESRRLLLKKLELVGRMYVPAAPDNGPGGMPF